ncbi:MAG: hypothetical protein DRO10_00535 [Thermoprotei archaeon]|nr:MAG: hypothetical protein DRO10_00535 [Thermoprotei archaeon]
MTKKYSCTFLTAMIFLFIVLFYTGSSVLAAEDNSGVKLTINIMGEGLARIQYIDQSGNLRKLLLREGDHTFVVRNSSPIDISLGASQGWELLRVVTDESVESSKATLRLVVGVNVTSYIQVIFVKAEATPNETRIVIDGLGEVVNGSKQLKLNLTLLGKIEASWLLNISIMSLENELIESRSIYPISSRELEVVFTIPPTYTDSYVVARAAIYSDGDLVAKSSKAIRIGVGDTGSGTSPGGPDPLMIVAVLGLFGLLLAVAILYRSKSRGKH